MKRYSIILICFLKLSLFFTSVMAIDSQYFIEGKQLYDNKDFDNSKTFFERDIVFNPKNEKSYLYLAKIFNNNNNDYEQEINLNTVLVLNPQNEEAIYMLALQKIKQSDYDHVKKLLDEFILVCKSFCSKQNEIDEKLNKINPEKEKNND